MKDNFTLREAALIVWSDLDRPQPTANAVKELLGRIFTGADLTPSCFVKSALMNYWVDVLLNPGKDNPDWPKNEWSSQQVTPDNLPESVLVNVYLNNDHRNSGNASSKIKLALVSGEDAGRLFAPSIYLPTEKLGLVRCQLKKQKEVAESELIIRRNNLEYYIKDDEEAMKRLEKFAAEQGAIGCTNFGRTDSTPSQRIELPVIGGREVIPLRLLLLKTEPQITPRLLVEALWNPRGDYSSCLSHEPMSNDWALVYNELIKIEYVDDLEKQLQQLPSGVSVTRADFESFDFHREKFQIKSDRPIPDFLRLLAWKGFDSDPATPFTSLLQQAEQEVDRPEVQTVQHNTETAPHSPTSPETQEQHVHKSEQVATVSGSSEVVIMEVSKTGGDKRSGKSFTSVNRFMDDLLDDYRKKNKLESEDFNLLMTYVSIGMESKDSKYGYKVSAIDRDNVTLKNKRKEKVISLNKLKTIWKSRKMRNPFEP